MNPKHVTNLDLSKALFEAGITKDYESVFQWCAPYVEGSEWGVYQQKEGTYPALLFTELWPLMRRHVLKLYPEEGYDYDVLKSSKDCSLDQFGTPLEALSALATYLLREGKFNKPTL